MECYNAALDLLLYVHSTKDLKLNFPGKCEIPKGIDPSMHSKITNNGGLLAYSDARGTSRMKLATTCLATMCILWVD